MPIDLSVRTPSTKRPEKRRGWAVRIGLVVAVVAVMLGVAKAWDSGYVSPQLWEGRPAPLSTVEVDEGEMVVYVNETGTLESASNTTIKCQVEALIGLVGGATKGASGGGAGGQSGSSSAAGGAQASSGSRAATTGTTKSAGTTTKSAGATKSAGTPTSTATSTASTTAGASTSGSSSAGGSSSGTTSNASTVTARPTIRSFAYTVTPYVSLRPATKSAPAATKGGATKGAGGGSRVGGGGGGGGGVGMGGDQEKPGSTRIIRIKEEGTQVSAGEVVCELDSSAFRDEQLAQRIKFDQARAWVVQARSILEVNEISLREYRDGIYPQDLMLIRQYLNTSRREEERARSNLAWSQPVFAKGFRTRAQYEADVLNLKRSEIALAEAIGMEERLLKYTGPKILKSLEAKLEANRADALAQEAAFQIESDRLKRLDRMVANCTLRAPHEGIVVYSLPASNGWRPPTPTIMEGATVREGQSIFELPDATKMRIRAKVNESKVGWIRVGQKASIRIDAFPSRTLSGTVTEVTAIPAPAAGPSSDIRVYFANVAIDSGGFEELRPGLSAEVSFFIDGHPRATRVPLQSLRWVDRIAFAAVATSADRPGYRWQPIEVGLTNENYAEVLGGLKPGDRVVSRTDDLPAPPPTASPALRASADPARSPG